MHSGYTASEQISYFADELHVTVLDTIVHHLDVVTSTFVSNPVAACLAIALRSDALENVLYVWPGLLVSTGHQARAIPGTLLTTGYTSSNESDALLSQIFGASVGVWEVGVTAVDDDVARLDVGEDRLDEVVYGLASHDEKHDATGLLQLGTEFLNGVSTDDGFA